MIDLIHFLEQWIETVIILAGYPGIAFLMMLEHLIPPIPSEIIMTFAGFQVAEGRLAFVFALLAGSIGSTLGALGIYAIGAVLKRDRLQAWVRRYGKWLLLSENDLQKALDTFDRHGRPAIFFGHILPGVRSLISLPAGLDGMPLPLFLVLTFLGTSLWNTILLSAGLLLHHNWRAVLSLIETYEALVWVLLIGMLIWFLFRQHGARKR